MDTRELRSFRFKYHTTEIKTILTNKNSTVGICVTDSFHPKDRQLWRENVITKDLIITAIPNQTGRFLFNDKDKIWKNVRNLFQGQIYLVKSKSHNNISIPLLQQFLATKKFYLRLLFVKDQLYRADAINKQIAVKLTEQAALIKLIQFLQYQLVHVILSNTIPTKDEKLN